MIRYSYLPLEKKLNGINFYDITRLNWNNFKFKRGISYYTLTKQNVDKFYEFIFDYYGSLVIEDWIYFINKIEDPTDLQVGQRIILPKLDDIDDFISDELGIQS